MKKVIDANYFQNPALEGYLRANKRNKVVFCEQARMETYKGDALKNIYRSMQITSKYPEQVIVLRSTSEIITLQDSSKASSRRNLEDPDQTKGFGKFCTQVQRAVRGDAALEAQIRKHGKLATQHFETVLRGVAALAQAIKEIERSIHPDHIRLLRTKQHLPQEACQGIVRNMRTLAASFFRNYPDIKQIPEAPLVYKTYIFRLAVTCYFLALRWIFLGGISGVSLDTLRNDVTDMSYVTCATYFDGLLSKDKKMQGVYRDTCYFLQNVFSA